MSALTRGPLPARVYWRRRLLLVVLAVGLVLGTTRLLTLGSDGADRSDAEPPDAAQVAAEPTGSESADPGVGPEADAREQGAKQKRTKQKQEQKREKRTRKRDRGPVLAEPDGACSDRDVAVTPTVADPEGGSAVTFTLELRAITSPACTWQVSPATLTMRLTSGKDQIWSSQQCPRAIPREEVVVRNNVSTEVEVTWSGRRSDDECSRLTEWALPGWYYVDVAALAGEPSNLHFELEKPEPEVVTETVGPKKRDRAKRDGAGRDRG